jgi:hypothetical protein
MIQQLEDLKAQHMRLRTGLEKLYYVTIQAVGSALSQDAARRYWNAMVRRMAGQGLVLKACDTYQLPAWLAASPLGEDVFRKYGLFRTMETSNVADLFPFGLGTGPGWCWAGTSWGGWSSTTAGTRGWRTRTS